MRGGVYIAAIAALASTALAIPTPMFIGVGPPVAPDVFILGAQQPAGDTVTYDAPPTTALPDYGPGNDANEVATQAAAPSITDTAQLSPESLTTVVVTATSPFLMTFTMTQTANPHARRTAGVEGVGQDFDSGRASIGRREDANATCTAESGTEGCWHGGKHGRWKSAMIWPGGSRTGMSEGWGGGSGSWSGWDHHAGATGGGTIGANAETTAGSDEVNADASTVAQTTAVPTLFQAGVTSPSASPGSPVSGDGDNGVVVVTSYTTSFETVTGPSPTAPAGNQAAATKTLPAAAESTQPAPSATSPAAVTSASSSDSDQVPAHPLPSGPLARAVMVADTALSDADKTAVLGAHNALRKVWGSGNMAWSNNLEAYATDWASRCVFNHTGGPFGENLAAGQGSGTPVGLFGGWKNETVSLPNAKEPDFNHKTAILWKSTSYVGCGLVQCPSMYQVATGGYTRVLSPSESWTYAGTNLVCNYYEPGNVANEGAYAANIGTCTAGLDACGPTSKPTAT